MKKKNPIIIPNQQNYQNWIWNRNRLEYDKNKALELKLRYKHAKGKI